MPRTHLPYQGHTRSTCQNPQAKSPGFSSLPQSKKALQKPPRIEPLATVPAQGGRGVGVHSTFVPSSTLPATGGQPPATGHRLPTAFLNAERWTLDAGCVSARAPRGTFPPPEPPCIRFPLP
jgi:hypothetical protein